MERKVEQPRKFAVCTALQLQHVGSWSFVLRHSFVRCSPSHFTQRGGFPQLYEICPNCWQAWNCAVPVFLKDSTNIFSKNISVIS